MNAITPNSNFGKQKLQNGVSIFPLLKPTMTFGLKVGDCFNLADTPCRLEAIHDDDAVELLNLKTMSKVRVEDENGVAVPPTLTFMRDAHSKGLCTQICNSESELLQMNWALSGRFGELSLSRAHWAARLAYRAIEQGVKMSTAACADWLSREYGTDENDSQFPKPSGTTLRRWMGSLKENGKKSWTLVTRRGRPEGRSPLDPRAARLVTLAAMYYWTRPRCKIVEAEAYLYGQIKKVNASLSPGEKAISRPSGETLRKRIHKLRSFDTYAAKFGRKQAEAMFGGSGEPMMVDRFLQCVLMDSTVLEQVIVFDADWNLPATRIGITLLMDVYTRAVLGASIYAGSPRYETTVEAIISSMLPPPQIQPEMLERFPGLVNVFGKAAAILPDNAASLLSGSSTTSLNDAGISLLLPPIEFPEAKAILERFMRTLKEHLAALPGTVIDPKRALELGYDAVGDAALTLPQIRDLVWQAINSHNAVPCDGLDGRSPLQVITETCDRRATPAFQDVDRLRLILGRTISVMVTRDGVEHDGIRYRNRDATTRFLDNNVGREAVRKASGVTRVSIAARGKRCDGNLDSIQIYDPVDEVWHTLYSTQPGYTDRLSSWEHTEYRRQAKIRNEKFATEEDRLLSRSITLRLVDKLAPKVKFRQRKDMAQLYLSDQFRKLAGDTLPTSLPDDLDIAVAQQEAPDTGREDSGVFPPRSATETKIPARHLAPERPANHNVPAGNSRVDDFDWDAVDITDDVEQDLPSFGFNAEEDGE